VCSLLHHMNVTATAHYYCNNELYNHIYRADPNPDLVPTTPHSILTLSPHHRSYCDPTVSHKRELTNASSSSASINRIAVFTATGCNHDKYDPSHSSVVYCSSHRFRLFSNTILFSRPAHVAVPVASPHTSCLPPTTSPTDFARSFYPISIIHSPHSRSSRSSRRTLRFCIRRCCFHCSRASAIPITSFFLPP
jgi:hypothetical protein